MELICNLIIPIINSGKSVLDQPNKGKIHFWNVKNVLIFFSRIVKVVENDVHICKCMFFERLLQDAPMNVENYLPKNSEMLNGTTFSRTFNYILRKYNSENFLKNIILKIFSNI